MSDLTPERLQTLAVPDLLDLVARLRTRNEALERENALLNEAATELDLLRDDVHEHLPAYVLDDGTDEPANERERIEYAGDEIKRLERENERLEKLLGVCNDVHGHNVKLKARNEALERFAVDVRRATDDTDIGDALAALDGVKP